MHFFFHQLFLLSTLFLSCKSKIARAIPFEQFNGAYLKCTNLNFLLSRTEILKTRLAIKVCPFLGYQGFYPHDLLRIVLELELL